MMSAFMFDLHADLNQFHDDHVKLSGEDKRALEGARDKNLTRIEAGLAAAGRPSFLTWRNQGGYAMDTLIQDPAEESDHDIDVALIFAADGTSSVALTARQRVAEALQEKGGQFLREPEARTNAVTVWYADGYHADFAIYRRSEDGFGRVKFEHASATWQQRGPDEVTDWFELAVTQRSPSGAGVSVRPQQLRRIVRFAKRFCRSRSSWSLPGGLITTALIVECYRPDPHRDDRALYNTLLAMKRRLDVETRVPHPCGGGRDLTAKEQFHNEVTWLRERLAENLPKLDILFDFSCTRAQARSAWDWIFNHAFWDAKGIVQKQQSEPGPYHVAIRCEWAFREGGKLNSYDSGSRTLPKELAIRFTVANTNVPTPYEVTWTCENEGDEAALDRQQRWTADRSWQDTEKWTSTKYKGTQRMTCEIKRGGQIYARAVHVVRIAGGSIRDQSKRHRPRL